MVAVLNWILRFGAACFVAALIASGDASAKNACGGNNEATCNPIFNGGFRCDHGYSSENGTCKPCGRRDQLACAVARGSGKCRAGLVAVGRYCRGKGCGAVGQKSCDGKCDGKYNQENDRGICEARGGLGQPRLRGLTFDCRKGFNFNRGSLYRRNTSSNYCEPCGGDGQIVCEAGVGRGFDRCNEGLDLVRRDGRDYCAVGISGKTKAAMMAELWEYASVLENVMGITDSAEEDEEASLEVRAANSHFASWAEGREKSALDTYNFKHRKPAFDALAQRLSRTRYQTLTPEDDASHHRPCGSQAFKSWSMSSRFSVPLVGDYEGGFVRRCGPSTEAQDSRVYQMLSNTQSFGISAGIGMTGAVWVKEFDQTAGPLHGYEVSMASLLDYMKIAKDLANIADVLESAGTFSPDLSVAFWFERDDDDRVGAFRGISMTFSGSVGLDAGGTYHKATVQ